MKKRRLKRNYLRLFKLVLILIVASIIISLLFFTNIHFLGVKSVNKDAKAYSTKSCLAFYPSGKKGKEEAKKLCSNVNDKKIFDYAKVKYGDYYLIDYGNNNNYFLDKDNKPIVVDYIQEEGKYILSDYLRYDMKKSEIDKAYTSEFAKQTSFENLNIENCNFEVCGQYLNVYYPEYDFTSSVPLKYLQDYIGINLGYKKINYVKPKYISLNRKTVAFTFDDGPRNSITPSIIDTLYKNDANATFFILGSRLEKESVEIIKDSIRKGNQYGSHTNSHPYLRLLDQSEEYAEIVGPANDLKNGYHEGSEYDFDGIDYNMTIYRAPYGEHKKADETISPYISIEWDCDSNDWSLRDKELIKEGIYDFESKNKDGLDGCIVLFHDTYIETAEAIDELVDELVDKGYQFVVIDDLLNILGIDKNKAYYPW